MGLASHPSFIDDIARLQRDRQIRASYQPDEVQFHDRCVVCTAALAVYLGTLFQHSLQVNWSASAKRESTRAGFSSFAILDSSCPPKRGASASKRRCVLRRFTKRLTEISDLNWFPWSQQACRTVSAGSNRQLFSEYPPTGLPQSFFCCSPQASCRECLLPQALWPQPSSMRPIYQGNRNQLRPGIGWRAVLQATPDGRISVQSNRSWTVPASQPAKRQIW
jgi:hypothetical protein